MVVAGTAVLAELQQAADVVGEQELRRPAGVEQAFQAVDALAVCRLSAPVAVVFELGAERVEAEAHAAFGDLAMPLRLDQLVAMTDGDAAQVGAGPLEDV